MPVWHCAISAISRASRPRVQAMHGYGRGVMDDGDHAGIAIRISGIKCAQAGSRRGRPQIA